MSNFPITDHYGKPVFWTQERWDKWNEDLAQHFQTRVQPSGYIEANALMSKEQILEIEAEMNQVFERHGCTYHELPKKAIVHDVSFQDMDDPHSPVIVALTYQKRLYKGILQEIVPAHE